MVVIGYHLSHEQFLPSRLLRIAKQAEVDGFDAAMCSDHFAPWSLSQGQSGYAWSWLGAALATTRLPMGLVTAPGQRYHPAIVAQAAGTLAEMFPGRFWAALGSGEAVNEHITGDEWPPKPEREARLLESVTAMRRLLAGETVDHSGSVRLHEARLWTRPEEPPPFIAAAVGPATAEWAADWADGLITVGVDPAALGEVLSAYRSAGGGGRAVVQVHVCLADTMDDGIRVAADQWSQATVPPPRLWDVETPEEFDRQADRSDHETLLSAVLIDDDVRSMSERLLAITAQGFDEIYLHHVGTDQEAFVERAGHELLPMMRSTA